MAETLQLIAYSFTKGAALLREPSGMEFWVLIGQLANRPNIISWLEPEDAFRLGSFHESHRRRRMAYTEQEAANA